AQRSASGRANGVPRLRHNTARFFATLKSVSSLCAHIIPTGHSPYTLSQSAPRSLGALLGHCAYAAVNLDFIRRGKSDGVECNALGDQPQAAILACTADTEMRGRTRRQFSVLHARQPSRSLAKGRYDGRARSRACFGG